MENFKSSYRDIMRMELKGSTNRRQNNCSLEKYQARLKLEHWINNNHPNVHMPYKNI